MHIGIVTETYLPEVNGVALTLGRLVRGLRARGHGLSLVHPRRPAFDRLADGRAGDTTLVAGLPAPGYPGVWIGLPAAARLRAQWAFQRPDVVYVATPGPLGWSAVAAARRLGVPVFSGFHTHFHRYARYYRAPWLGRALTRGLRRFHNATAATLVPTADVRDELHAAGFLNLRVLGRGVDTELFDPARRSAELRAAWGASAEDLVAVYVGRVAAEKNVALAIETARHLREAGAIRRFVVVGDGPLRAALQRAHPDLVFTGVQSGPALGAHYASADLFLFPSETETFGNVVLEAMASGLAVVAYAAGAARIHIQHGATGILAPLGDHDAFTAGAAALARSPGRARRLGLRARAAVATEDWPRVVQRFEWLLAGGADVPATDPPQLVRA